VSTYLKNARSKTRMRGGRQPENSTVSHPLHHLCGNAREAIGGGKSSRMQRSGRKRGGGLNSSHTGTEALKMYHTSLEQH